MVNYSESMEDSAVTMKEQAENLLLGMLGTSAYFREGQWEAIDLVAQQRGRVLVVQRTGWGKSIVYFLATKLLRDNGAGITLLISPLLALMRNQIQMAQRIGIRAGQISSTNGEEWDQIEKSLELGQYDVLLVSPERLANQRFLTKTLPAINKSDGIGLLVIDEAHCISDWGHDFRPDYRRIVRIIENLPKNVPIIATTATANNRVVADIQTQLGSDLKILRGPLIRDSLRIQNIKLHDQAERLAWLSQNLVVLPGSGIIYCLTIADCHRVATWLRIQKLEVLEYHSKMGNTEREHAEQQLLHNQVKALIATVALGMGFDKPDLGFVIHYQRPGSLVAYYQQIGRAGRAVDNAFAILLNGHEDDDIQEYFIESAFPKQEQLQQVLEVVEKSEEGLSINGILHNLNLSKTKIDKCLKFLEVEGAIAKDKSSYFRTANAWQPDLARSKAVTQRRYQELARMQEFVAEQSRCLMEFVADELDDPFARRCGKCANCNGPFIVMVAEQPIVEEALKFLQKDYQVIEPRKQWPGGGLDRGIGQVAWKGRISVSMQNQEGRSLSIYNDAGWGQAVRQGKYGAGFFSDDLVRSMVELVERHWQPTPKPTWVTAVPSLRHPELVAKFAQRVALALNLPFVSVLVKAEETSEQKTMQNSDQQAANIANAFKVSLGVLEGPVLLIDDMVDSRWTFTICGYLLREAGSGPVYPLALATVTNVGDSD
jgi:ATP-dependent DNA helicase RecQ